MKLLLRRLMYQVTYCFDALLHQTPEIFVLCYHSISSDTWRYGISLKEFTEQLKYLLIHFQPIDMETLEKYILRHEEVPKHSFILTFDDGYKDILQLRKLCTQLGVKPCLFTLASPDLANRQEMETDRALLSTKEILKLKDAGWTIGCHGATHCDFSKMTSQQIQAEVIDSKKILEQRLGFPIKYFAYPKGKYSPEVEQAVRVADYKLGFSMDNSFISPSSDPYILPRVGVDRTHSLSEFRSVFLPSSVVMRKFIFSRFGNIAYV